MRSESTDRRAWFRRCAALGALVAVGLACQPGAVEWAPLPPPISLGEAVYEIVRLNVGAGSECAAERVALIEEEHEPFVESFDAMVDVGESPGGAIETALPVSIEAALLPLVDDDRLPALTGDVAELLALLIDDYGDRRRETLAALLRFGQARGVLVGQDLLALAEGVLDDPDATAIVHAISELAALDDHGVPLATSLAHAASRRLRHGVEVSGCGAIEIAGLDETLLRHDLLPDPDELSFGAPAWAVLADRNGNPAVNVDPETGTLYAPFVDADHDGVADVNADGIPTDDDGDPLFIATFVNSSADSGADSGRRDKHGRLVSAAGDPVLAYFDAKRTPLSVVTQLLGEAVDAGVHRDGVAVLLAILGEQTLSECDGDPCRVYPSDDNPLADLAFILLEDLRYERTSTLLETWRVVVEDEPVLAEQVLVDVGGLLATMREGGLSLTDTAMIDLLAAALPLVSDIFASESSTGESTARLLLEVLHELGQVARDLPDELLLNMRYTRLHKDDACSAAAPDESRSTPVDLSLPRYYYSNDPPGGWIDNRTALEQSIELLAAVDCGRVPLTGGKTVGEVVIGVMADSSPSTACNIIDVSLGIMDILPNVSEAVGSFALDVMGCDGDAVWSHLEALDALAKTGVLDAYLPLANAFDDRDQVRTLIDILVLVADDLRLDEDGDPATVSTTRRAIPTLVDVLEADAADALFDLLDVLATVPAVDGSGTLSDVVVDSFAYLLDDRGVVRTRQGDVGGTSIGLEMLEGLRELAARVEAAGVGAPLRRTLDHLTGYLERTRVDDRGTPDPSDDVTLLRDRRLLPALTALLAFARDVWDRTPAERDCWFDLLQRETDDLLVGPDFAVAIRALDRYVRSDEARVIDGALRRWLVPQAGRSAPTDVFGPLMQIASAAIQSPGDTEGGVAVARYTSRALEVVDLAGALATADALLVEDPNQIIVTILRNAMDAGEAGRAPLSFFADLIIDLSAFEAPTGDGADLACMPDDGAWGLDEAEQAVSSTVEFLRDTERGLPAVYDLIEMRAGARSSDGATGAP